MKKIVLILALIFTVSALGQKSEYFTFNLQVDPSATIKEKSLNVVAELELVSNFGYAKLTSQFLNDLQGGYLDYGGGLGLNKHLGRFEQATIYGGLRLGFIKRGFNSDQVYTYPLFGYEAGFKFKVSENIFIVLKSTYDYREDFKYSGANPKYRFSNYVGVNFKI